MGIWICSQREMQRARKVVSLIMNRKRSCTLNTRTFSPWREVAESVTVGDNSSIGVLTAI
jgi:hypothetical protein